MPPFIRKFIGLSYHICSSLNSMFNKKDCIRLAGGNAVVNQP